MRIGELLVMNDLITQNQLEEVLKNQINTKKKLGELLTDSGILSERQLVEVLEFQLGFPVINMYDTVIDPTVVQLLPEKIARRHCIMPIEQKNGKIKVAMLDPLNYEAVEEIRLANGMEVHAFIAMRSEIEQAITRYYGVQESVQELMEDFSPKEEENIEMDADDQSSPIVKLVNQLIQSAIQQRASDIHIDPQEKNIAVRYRIDGVLHTEKTLTKSMQEVLTARLKIVSKLNIAERRLPQDGRIQMQVDNRKIDIQSPLSRPFMVKVLCADSRPIGWY